MANDEDKTPFGGGVEPFRESNPAYTKRFTRPEDADGDRDAPQRVKPIEPNGINIEDILDTESPDQLKALVRLAFRVEYSSGPYPPPAFVDGYDKEAPGMGREVLQAGIDRVRASIEKDVEDGKARRTIDACGQALDFVWVLLFVGFATLWVHWGYGTQGAWILGTVVVMVIVAFISSSQIAEIAKSLGPGERIALNRSSSAQIRLPSQHDHPRGPTLARQLRPFHYQHDSDAPPVQSRSGRSLVCEPMPSRFSPGNRP